MLGSLGLPKAPLGSPRSFPPGALGLGLGLGWGLGWSWGWGLGWAGVGFPWFPWAHSLCQGLGQRALTKALASAFPWASLCFSWLLWASMGVSALTWDPLDFQLIGFCCPFKRPYKALKGP